MEKRIRFRNQIQELADLVLHQNQDHPPKNVLLWTQILHPSLSNAAGHQFWAEVCSTGKSAGLVSVIFKPDYDLTAVRKFCDSLQLFKLGFSWGGPVSLAMLYDLKQMRSLSNTHLQQGLLVRFCIGLEHPEDLIQDIQNALKQLEWNQK